MDFKLDFKPLVTLDLQYLAEGNGHPFAAEEAPTEPHPFADDSSAFSQFAEEPNPLLSNDVQSPDTPTLQGGEQERQTVENGQEQPSQQQLQEEVLRFGDKEIRAYGDDVRELHQDYNQMIQNSQKQAQDLEQARQLLNQYQTLMQQQPMQQQEPQQPQQPIIDPARMQKLEEEYQERMYESKFEADKWWNEQPEVQELERQRIEAIVQQRVQEEIGPIQQERQLQQQVLEAQNRYPDFDDHTTAMQTLLEENPQLADFPNAIDNLYFIAKGRAAQTAPQPEQLLNDPNFQQQVMQNEQIRNMILQNYQQTKMQNQPPVVMAQQAASQTPISAGNRKPRTLQESTTMFNEHLERIKQK